MYLKRDNDTDRLQKSVYIYTFVFTGTYTGPFCHNPVESFCSSKTLPVEPSIPQDTAHNATPAPAGLVIAAPVPTPSPALMPQQLFLEPDSENRSNYAMCVVSSKHNSPSFSDAALCEAIVDICNFGHFSSQNCQLQCCILHRVLRADASF